MRDDPILSPELLLRAYAAGVFPMAEGRDDPAIHWVDPRRRGVIPLGGFHMSRSLRRRLRRMPYRVTFDADFAGVLDGCADRPETWINRPIREAYLALHALGHAHSAEVWEASVLVGGIYGVALGAAFFGESMFSRRTDASKIALAFLIDRLRTNGFRLFDVQFLTPHLARLGAEEIGRDAYHRRLADALARRASFGPPGAAPDVQSMMQRMSQTS